MDIVKGIPKHKELFLNYGEKYWTEESFEDYLAGRGQVEDSAEGPEQGIEQDAGEFTYSSDANKGLDTG